MRSFVVYASDFMYLFHSTGLLKGKLKYTGEWAENSLKPKILKFCVQIMSGELDKR